MKIQSAGRLGNTLFIWAFALEISKKNKTQVSIFTDRFHSDVGIEALTTRKLLSDPCITFCNSDFYGGLLAAVDWTTGKSKKLGRALKKMLGISDEPDPITEKTQILRGYFQYSDQVLNNVSIIVEKLNRAINLVEQESEKVQKLKSTYPRYQVIHVRLGDFVNSEIGVISPNSYKSELEPNIPTLICTNGSEREVLELVDFPVVEILTPDALSTWETLCLINSATRFVGVNSTLSWWGAFLAIANGNKAFLPDRWTKEGKFVDSDRLKLEGCIKYEAHFI